MGKGIDESVNGINGFRNEWKPYSKPYCCHPKTHCPALTQVFINDFLKWAPLSLCIYMPLPQSASTIHEFCRGKSGQFLLFFTPSPAKPECLSPPHAFSLIPHTPGDTGCPAACPPHTSLAWRFCSTMPSVSHSAGAHLSSQPPRVSPPQGSTMASTVLSACWRSLCHWDSMAQVCLGS